MGVLGVVIILSGVSSSFAALQYEEIYTSQTGAQKVLILVNSAIFDAIYESSLEQYILDLEAEDYYVTLVKYIGGTPQELKDYIKLISGLKGVLFIGDLPVAWFEIANDFNMGYARFPIDLFYMDLDGTWQDIDNNGNYDNHTGNLSPEIWLGRLTSSTIYHTEMDQVGLLRNYFAKNSAYRRGKLLVQQRALSYPDDEWANYGKCDLDSAYSNVTVINDRAGTNATDYKNRLKENYEWIQVCVHSNSYVHYFETSNPCCVYNTDIQTIDPTSLFYNLFACFNCRYTCFAYMGGQYIFAKTNGLAAVGSTKIGSMLSFNYFYPRLGQSYRESLGAAFKYWFSSRNLSSLGGKQWFYGMTLLGDPTLTLDPPIASINSITPSSPIQGQAVTFTGSGKIFQGSITAYAWRSSRDGFLSSSSSFSTNRLSVGEHTIYLKVRDYHERWSSETKYTLKVDPDTTPPITPIVIDQGTYTTTTLAARWGSSDPESEIAEYQYRIIQDSTTGTVIKGWTSTETTPWVKVTVLTLQNGKSYYFAVKAKNGAGLWSTVGYSDGIIVDTIAPTGIVAINNNALYTTTTVVTLNLSATDTGSGMGTDAQMRFSNDNVNWSTPEPYATTKSWTLTSGDGPKTVYAKFKDIAGNWSSIVSDTINLDTVALTITGLNITKSGSQYIITFTLDRQASVTGRISNLTGTLLRTFASNVQAVAGTNSLYWDGKNSQGVLLSSGSYILQITATAPSGKTTSAIKTFNY